MTAAALSSMTGFGAARGEADWGAWSVEAKSVNGRSLDVRLNTPPGFDGLDPVAKSAASARFSRGNIQISVRIEPTSDEGVVQVNTALLETLIAKAETANPGDETSLDSNAVATLMTIRGVVDVAAVDTRALAGNEAVLTALSGGIIDALDALLAARSGEGVSQSALFLSLLSEFRSVLSEAETAAANQPSLLKTRLDNQLAELGAADKVDADRLAAEVALSAAKADVREEIDRLKAHFDSADRLLAEGSPVGRKLDFLSQEIGREANTLCSKSASLELTNAGLALKALNDQFKEQAANVE